MMRTITPSEFDQIISDSKEIIIVGYFDSSISYQEEYLTLDSFCKENPEVRCYVMNQLSGDFLASRFGTLGTPTYLLFKNGELIKTILGKLDGYGLKEVIQH